MFFLIIGGILSIVTLFVNVAISLIILFGLLILWTPKALLLALAFSVSFPALQEQDFIVFHFIISAGALQ